VHDNQCLGYGLLSILRRLPVVATVHHPITMDLRLELAVAGRKRRMALRRWYSFVRMQRRVVRRLPRVLSPSRAARADVAAEFGVSEARSAVVPNGVDPAVFKPLASIARLPGRIITTASADVPLKGLPHLLEALAKLRTERDADLVVVGPRPTKGPVRQAIERFALEDAVHFETRVDAAALAALYARSQVAVVPSLYEGFSLPAAEAMACGVPVVATTAGAIPEVVGPDGHAGLLVPPGDAGALAQALGRVLGDDELRARLGSAGRERASTRFSWSACAAATASEYRRVLSAC
jgi:glycosyltransferase involved in cell wall biosynthesis